MLNRGVEVLLLEHLHLKLKLVSEIALMSMVQRRRGMLCLGRWWLWLASINEDIEVREGASRVVVARVGARGLRWHVGHWRLRVRGMGMRGVGDLEEGAVGWWLRLVLVRRDRMQELRDVVVLLLRRVGRKHVIRKCTACWRQCRWILLSNILELSWSQVLVHHVLLRVCLRRLLNVIVGRLSISVILIFLILLLIWRSINIQPLREVYPELLEYLRIENRNRLRTASIDRLAFHDLVPLASILDL